MTDRKRSLSFLLIWSLVFLSILGDARGLPLAERLTQNSQSPSAIPSHQLRVHRMTERSRDPGFNSTDSRVTTDTTSLPQAYTTESNVITEPQCLLHHEYAEILKSEYYGRDSRVRSFINRHNEVRYYICLPCHVCPPGVQILSPCHRKRDTICSTMCVDPAYVYDPVQQICLPQNSSQSAVTPAATFLGSLAGVTTVQSVFMQDDSTNKDDVDNAVDQLTTVPVPRHKAVWTQITIITVGVISLNVVVIAGAILVFRRSKCRKRNQGFPSGRYNNALSSPELCAAQSALQPLSAPNQGSGRRDTVTSIDDRPAASQGTRDEMATAGNNQIHSELALVSHNQAKESNLNVYHEPAYEQGAQTISPIREEELDSPASIQVLHGKDPYWLVMIGQFGPEGGILSSEYSDVILEIPPGAIPADHRDQTIIAKISLHPDAVGPKLKDPDSLWLTPLVEFESPGLDRFNKDVRMRLPHCARMQPGWTFKVNYTDPTTATSCKKHTDPTSATINGIQDPEAETTLLPDGTCSETPWFSVEQKCLLTKSGKSCRKPSWEESDVTFTVDEKYFNVSTSHFSKYCCSGCHKEHPLHLESVVYWNHTKVGGHEQMDLNVYILDPIKDSRMKVKENEQSSDCHTGYKPLFLSYKKKTKEASPLEVCVLEDSMGDDWEWRLHTYKGDLPAKRVLKIQSLIRCCSPLLPSHQTFSLRPKNAAENMRPSLFQAMVCIKQQNMAEEDLTRILVNVPLIKERTVSSVSLNNNKERDTVVTDDDIDLVVNQLPVKQWRHLYRKLMGKGADNVIEHIQAKDPSNTREQIHQALASWRMSRGREATVGSLTAGLDAVGLRGIAESLHPGMDTRGKLITQDSMANFKETQV